MNLSGGRNWRREAEQMVVKPFRLVTTTLLSLLLPLSFLFLSRLASSSFLFSLVKSQPKTESSFFVSISLYTNPTILYAVVSSISVYTLVLGLTTKITATDSSRSIAFYPRVSIAWLTLFLVQISVGLGLEGTVLSDGLVIGTERNFLSRLVFFCGLHEVMLLWYRLIVKPVVDNTLNIGGDRGEETVVVERVALALSCGTLWWWKLRDEVEALVGVAETKRALMLLLLPINGNGNVVGLDVGIVDFVNWWLYYIVVMIGMVRIVKGCLWFGMVLLFEPSRPNHPRGVSSASSAPILHCDDDEGDNKV